jgi:hypothetical protein
MQAYGIQQQQQQPTPSEGNIEANGDIYQLLESFDIRISILEGTWPKARSQWNHSSLDSLLSMLGHRIAHLEQVSGTHSFQPKPSKSLVLQSPKTNRQWACPADSCNRGYGRLDHFHKHIETSGGTGHELLRKIILQRRCIRCNSAFRSPQLLVRHERCTHKLEFESRLELFTPFWESLGIEYLRNKFHLADLASRSRPMSIPE